MIDYQSIPNLPTLFFDQATRLSARPLLWRKRDGAYRSLSWQDTAAAVKDLSRGLRDLGLEKGERVVLVSENRPEWLMSDLAIMSAGGITVPAYTTNTTTDHLHLLTDSGAVGVIVSSEALAKKLLPAVAQAPNCRWVLSMEALSSELLEAESGKGFGYHLWDDVLAAGRALPDDVAETIGQAGREDIACFIYTSGTGGVPKGVMLSHRAILCNCMGANHLLQEYGLADEVFLSFLPLSHAYEHTAGQFFPISIGAEIYYGEGVESLLTNLAEARPTIMTAVPRLYESMHQRLQRSVAKEGGMKAKFFGLAVQLGEKRLADPKSLGLVERLQDCAMERLVRDKVRDRFGGRLKAMVSGGAGLNPEIGNYFTALGLTILQGYGQTESAPVISANPPGRVKIKTVGPPLKGVEVKIAEDGEILVRGDLLMSGYWGREEATAEAIRDGWLHTGDIGAFDADGYLTITDRKKDIIVLSGGDNVSPARVESFLTLEPEIGQAMVYGNKRPALVALLVPDSDFLRDWARKNSKSRTLADVATDPDLLKALAPAVDRVNKGLANLEKIRRFAVADAPFSVESEELTPTMKIRRHKILARYDDRLEGLYGKS